MSAPSDPLSVLAEYPLDLGDAQVESLGSAGGFSGARFWRVVTPAGCYCLRQWPPGGPEPERLPFVHAVLAHVSRAEISVALPLPTRAGPRHVERAGRVWELAPWMPGRADFRRNATEARLEAAMRYLAAFHRAAATFRRAGASFGPSPALAERLDSLRWWLAGGLASLAPRIQPRRFPELQPHAERLVSLFPNAARASLPLVEACAGRHFALQPCIRDVWHDHVFFIGDRVSGLIDFGSMAVDHVACDVARLLGSLVQDDRKLWSVGLCAYRTVRPLTEDEVSLVYAFDRSSVALSGLTWIDWIYRQRRAFDSVSAVLDRFETILARLERLATSL